MSNALTYNADTDLRLEICIYVLDRHQAPVRVEDQAEVGQAHGRIARSRRIVIRFEEPDIETIVRGALPKDGRSCNIG